jgi:hypothetical protein
MLFTLLIVLHTYMLTTLPSKISQIISMLKFIMFAFKYVIQLGMECSETMDKAAWNK